MFTFNQKTLIVLLASALLTACGGGGGGGDSSAPAATQSTQTATETEAAPETETTLETASIDDIIIAEDNDLSSTFDLQLQVSKLDEQRVYLSVCENYQALDNGEYDVDYNGCIVRTSLTDSGLDMSLTLANHSDQLVAAIWYFDGNPPIYIEWQKTNVMEEQWSFEI
ncbi:hypothetical protein HR060_04805 [Catenovulum sp. SM1970]|uniref:hypothetical protein n=1 Tax=Marinifaba aquimaris TaxID=2741323 RepID=UPI001572B8AD|nr:hypothetical protein [Marinifaba aquimaris]NTS76182.1 hypothetical protein [Marinifaba aquimaris]